MRITLTKAKSFLLMIIFPMVAFGANECASTLQSNGLDPNGTSTDYNKLWECPSLQNVALDDNGEYPFIHKLQDVDFDKGNYKCAYYFKKSGEYKQSCLFHSKLYDNIKNTFYTNLKGSVGSDGTVTTGLLSKDGQISVSDLLVPPATNRTVPVPLTNSLTAFNDIRDRLNRILNGDPSVSAETAEDRQIQEDIRRLQRLVYDQLVGVWENGYSNAGVRKGHTFSNFIAGVITLDPNIVDGYDSDSGKLKIRQEWKTDAMSITDINDPNSGIINSVINYLSAGWRWIVSTIGGEEEAPKTEVEKTLYNGGLQYKISSYADLFEDKLWGFYYVLQERFDIGYTYLSTVLLFLMSGWLFATVGIGEGVRYFSDQDKYKMELREGAYLKTMIVAGTLGLFFLSMPSGLNDTQSSDGTFTQNEIRKNYTIAKGFIRQTAQYGANVATMFNDLGLAAFVEFVSKREVMMSVSGIKRSLESSIEDMYMYSTALSIQEACKENYFGLSDVDFINGMGRRDYPVNESWINTSFATQKNISQIDFATCQKAYRITLLAPWQIANAVGEAKAQSEGSTAKLSEATYLLNYNNIALNNKIGWVGGFSTVLSYFLMKNNDMFFDNPNLEEKAKEEAQKITKSITYDAAKLERNSLLGDAQDSIAYGVSTIMDTMNGLYIYNILPMFSDIQKSIMGYMERVYDSKLKIYLEGDKASGVKPAKFIRKMRQMIKKTAGKALSKINILGTALNAVMPDITSPIVWHTVILALSYILAIQVWDMTFNIIFTILVSLLFVIAFVLYFFDLIVHFVTSLFMFVWAFTKHAAGQGDGKIKEWFKNTIIIVFMKPTILVFGLYIFIFSYEMLNAIYMYVFTSVTTGLLNSISIMSAANSNMGLLDSISSYTTVMSMQTVAEVTIKLFSLYVAYISIIKMPSVIYKKLGVDSDDAASHHQITESVSQKAERHNNPIQ